MKLESSHLELWADSVDAHNQLPTLVRRLVHETTPTLSELRFPSDSDVQMPGFDGKTVADEKTAWVPQGTAYWEMSCDQKIEAKANADFEKRTKKRAEYDDDATFVFVTLRKWTKKDDWVREKQALGIWTDVRVLDAVDLKAWLEIAPIATLWIHARIQVAVPGFTSSENSDLMLPGDWLRRWASATNPPISDGLVTKRRGRDGVRLLELLHDPSQRVLTIAADDQQEAIAFVIATLNACNEDSLLDRMLVTSDVRSLIPPHTAVRPIIIADEQDTSTHQSPDLSQVNLIRPISRGARPDQVDLALTRIPSEAFVDSLKANAGDEERARNTARNAGYSLAVYRRQHAEDPPVSLPSWANDDSLAPCLVAFAMVGSWTEHSAATGQSMSNEWTIIELISGLPDDRLREALRSAKDSSDPPVKEIRGEHFVVSQLEILLTLGASLSESAIETFLAATELVFSERPDEVELPEAFRPLAESIGEHYPYSERFREGLLNTLCLLATRADEICRRTIGIRLQYEVDKLVTKLLSTPSDEQWRIRGPHFQLLAEASPGSFLQCINGALKDGSTAEPGSNEPVRHVLAEGHLRCQLLWALEVLGWESEHFMQVTEILMRLQAFEPGDNLANKASTTLAALFQMYFPATGANLALKKRALVALKKQDKLRTIQLCFHVIGNDPRHVFYFSVQRPRWREFVLPEEMAKEERFEYYQFLSKLIMDGAPFEPRELSRVVEGALFLQEADRNRLTVELERWRPSATDHDLSILRNEIRYKTSSYIRSSKDDANIESYLRKLACLTEPRNVKYRHRWLFDKQWLDWESLNEFGTDDEYSSGALFSRLKELRSEALTEVIGPDGANSGPLRIVEFANLVNEPRIIGEVLSSLPEYQAMLKDTVVCALDHQSESSESVLAAILARSNNEQLTVAFEACKSHLDRDPGKLQKFARSLPNTAAGWRLAERMGESASEQYWKNVFVFPAHLDTDEEAFRHAVEMLLSVGRVAYAVSVARVCHELIPTQLWVKLLEAIIDSGEAGIQQQDSYDITFVFSCLDRDSTFDEDAIIELELALLPLVITSSYNAEHDGRVAAVHRKMSRDPKYFVHMLEWAQAVAEELSKSNAAKSKGLHEGRRISTPGWILRHWDNRPGTSIDGTICPETFRKWCDNARSLAKDANCLEKCDEHIGTLCATFPTAVSEEWPHPIICDFLEHSCNASVLREYFNIGVVNKQGVTHRAMFSGGEQERDVAEMFDSHAERLRTHYPQLADSICRIAKIFRASAKFMDDQSEIEERW